MEHVALPNFTRRLRALSYFTGNQAGQCYVSGQTTALTTYIHHVHIVTIRNQKLETGKAWERSYVSLDRLTKHAQTCVCNVH